MFERSSTGGKAPKGSGRSTSQEDHDARVDEGLKLPSHAKRADLDITKKPKQRRTAVPPNIDMTLSAIANADQRFRRTEQWLADQDARRKGLEDDSGSVADDESELHPKHHHNSDRGGVVGGVVGGGKPSRNYLLEVDRQSEEGVFHMSPFSSPRSSSRPETTQTRRFRMDLPSDRYRPTHMSPMQGKHKDGQTSRYDLDEMVSSAFGSYVGSPGDLESLLQREPQSDWSDFLERSQRNVERFAEAERTGMEDTGDGRKSLCDVEDGSAGRVADVAKKKGRSL